MTYQPLDSISEFLEEQPQAAKPPEQENFIPGSWKDPTSNGGITRGQRALSMAVQKVLEAPDGDKHNTLVKMSYLMGGYVGAGELSESEVVQALQHAIRTRANVDNIKDADRAIIVSVQEGKSKPVPPDNWSPPRAQSQPPMLDQAPPETQELTPDEINAMLEAASIDLLEELAPPPVCLEVEQNGTSAIIGTRGNFSMIIGKAKSRKTFFITIALAAAVCNDNVLGLFKGSLPESNNIVLYFDTEQGRYHVQKAAKRVLRLSGNLAPANFKAYGLRKHKPSERLQIIETAINNTPNLGMVVIDGVRDLVNSINDEELATMLASKLLKWTEEKEIHIMCVLHQNKGDNNARGHLGTELQNKAETVLSITKDAKNKEMSMVAAEYCREKEFEPFAFGIDENGVPVLIDHWELVASASNSTTTSKSLAPIDWPTETHSEILNKVFNKVEFPRYGQLVSQIKLTLMDKGVKIGDNKIKDFITWYHNQGFITKQGLERSKDCFYQLVPLV